MEEAKTIPIVFVEMGSRDDDDNRYVVHDVPVDEDPEDWYYNHFGVIPDDWHVQRR